MIVTMQALCSNPTNSMYALHMQTGRPSKRPRPPFGERLHALREQAGLSQAQVADKLGISPRAYGFWGTGSRSRFASRTTLHDSRPGVGRNGSTNICWGCVRPSSVAAVPPARHGASSRPSANCHASSNERLWMWSRRSWLDTRTAAQPTATDFPFSRHSFILPATAGHCAVSASCFEKTKPPALVFPKPEPKSKPGRNAAAVKVERRTRQGAYSAAQPFVSNVP